MIDLNAIRAAADFCETRGMVVELEPATVIALLDRLEAAEKDAARYRWLRDGNDHKNSPATQIAMHSYGLEWDAAIDAAIDAAMKEQK